MTPTQEKLIQQFNRNVAWLQQKERKRTMISERDAMTIFDIGKDRLRQLRLGYNYKGRPIEKVLFKWKSKNGRRIEYDLQELEKFFNRKQ